MKNSCTKVFPEKPLGPPTQTTEVSRKLDANSENLGSSAALVKRAMRGEGEGNELFLLQNPPPKRADSSKRSSMIQREKLDYKTRPVIEGGSTQRNDPICPAFTSQFCLAEPH